MSFLMKIHPSASKICSQVIATDLPAPLTYFSAWATAIDAGTVIFVLCPSTVMVYVPAVRKRWPSLSTYPKSRKGFIVQRKVMFSPALTSCLSK